MTNAQKFRETFGIYATEMWAMSEQDFLKWLNADTLQTDLLVTTPRKSRESHEKDCETCRDKDAYDEWQGNCDECENGSMYTPQTESHITCYGTCTDKCGAYENGDCTLNARKADTPQTEEVCDKADRNCNDCWKQLHCRAKDTTQIKSPSKEMLNISKKYADGILEVIKNTADTPQTDCGWK